MTHGCATRGPRCAPRPQLRCRSCEAQRVPADVAARLLVLPVQTFWRRPPTAACCTSQSVWCKSPAGLPPLLNPFRQVVLGEVSNCPQPTIRCAPRSGSAPPRPSPPILSCPAAGPHAPTPHLPPHPPRAPARHRASDPRARAAAPTPFPTPTPNPLVRRTPVSVDWVFNGWGDLYGSYEKDRLVARKLSEVERLPFVEVDMVLEGGSIHVDGEG